MKKILFFNEESVKTQKSIQNVLSYEEMMAVRGGGKVGEEGDGPSF